MTPGSFLLNSSFTSQIAQAIGAVIVRHFSAYGEAWDIGAVIVRHFPAYGEAWDIGVVVVRHFPAGTVS